MTSSILGFRATTTGQPANHGGRNYIPMGIPSGLIASLEGLYLFGSNFDPVYAEADVPSDWSIGDHSRNGRHLTRFGSTPVGAQSFTSNTSDYYLAPITGADLKAAGPDGSFTVYCIGKFPNSFGVAIGTWDFANIDTFALGRSISTGNRYQVLTTYADAGTTDQNTPILVTDADTGTLWDFLACVWDIPNLTITLYRQKAGGSLQAVTPVALNADFSPGQRITFGRSTPPAVNFVGGCELALCGYFSSAVSAQGIADLQGTTKTLVATGGITI